MTKKPPVKCPVCNEYFQRETTPFEHYKNRYYHKSCFESKNEMDQNKEKLIKYIERLLHKKADYKIKNQLQLYSDKGFTYEDIYNALYYFFEIRNNSTAKANGGIGIVPYVIDEAREYFENKKDKVLSTNNINPIIEERKVTIPDPTKKSKYKLKTIINISEL